jgi:phosphate transport system ATP-binding protein
MDAVDPDLASRPKEEPIVTVSAPTRQNLEPPDQGARVRPSPIAGALESQAASAATESVPGADRAASAPALEARDYHLYYGSHHALHGISLSIPPSSITAIIGPSGCGKSTLLRSFNRMNDLIAGVRTTGELRVSGRNVLESGTDVVDLRRRVGMVFQRPNPFPQSIFDNVSFGLRLLGLKSRTELEARVEASLQRAALWSEVRDRLHRSALALSGGQQQRLCIARCLAVEPTVILMDEPASALDPTATARIEELVLALKARYTIVVVTHNMQQAARISDRTAFMLEGRLIEVDDTSALFTRPSQKLTEDYITGRFG